MRISDWSSDVCSSDLGPLVGILVAQVQWQGMFLWMMVPALIASLAAYFFIPKQVTQTVIDEEPAPETKPPYVNILKKPSLWLFSLAAICLNIPYWCFLVWMPCSLLLARYIDLNTIGMVADRKSTRLNSSH